MRGVTTRGSVAAEAVDHGLVTSFKSERKRGGAAVDVEGGEGAAVEEGAHNLGALGGDGGAEGGRKAESGKILPSRTNDRGFEIRI